MGIKHLKSYISKNNYFVPHELKSAPLIIDGNSISIMLSQCPDVDPRFGGDYNIMYDRIYKFFDKLHQFDVTPIVIMDGRSKDQKEETVKMREKQSFKKIKDYNRSFKPDLFQPYFLLKTEIFFDVLKDLDIFVCRSDSEADGDIIALAKALKCSILSCHYGFCLCENVTFIPWKDELLEGGCFRFDKDKFLTDHKISTSVLPLVPVLANDDHFQMDVIDDVLGQTIGPFDRCKEAINWLQNKDFNSAKNEIISALEKKSFKTDDIKRNIDFVVESYNNPKTTLYSTFRANPLINNYLQETKLNVQEDDMMQKFKVPENIAKMVRECRLPCLMLDMLTHKEYYCKSYPIEYLKEPSLHAPSKRLIQGIYALLLRNKTEKPPIYLKIRKNGTVFQDENREEILPLEISNRKNFEILLEIFEIDESFREMLNFFDNGWFIFILAFIYWRQVCRPKIRPAHIHSILLTAFSLNVIKNEFPINNKETISRYFRNLKEADKKFYSLTQIPQIKMAKSDNKKLNDIFHIHMYLTFQQCLFYTMHIVRLLDLPYEIKISEFINGGFFHSFFTNLETKLDCLNFVKVWFDRFENLENLYRLMISKLERFS